MVKFIFQSCFTCNINANVKIKVFCTLQYALNKDILNINGQKLMTKKDKQLPKYIIMMVEKGNLVNAIKNLSSDENISMDEAKQRIDDYEAELKAKQQQQQDKIIKKQGVANKNDNNQEVKKINMIKLSISLLIIIILVLFVLYL